MPRKMSCREVADRVGRWANVTKIIMGVCFCILFILGMALLIAAGVALADANAFGQFAITGFKEIIIFALCLGIFVAIVSIVGALGYFSLNKTLLIIFAAGMAILVILQVACGATAFAYRDDYDEIISEGWNHAEASSRQFLEQEFKCCGGVNITDAPVAPECLAFLPFYIPPPDWADGCVPVLAQKAHDNIVAIGIGDIIITVLELAVIIVTIIVVVKIHGAQNNYHKFTDEGAMDGLR